MRRTPSESAAAPTSHSTTDPAEFHTVCSSKPNQPNQTDSNATLPLYATNLLGSKHQYSALGTGLTLITNNIYRNKWVFSIVNKG